MSATVLSISDLKFDVLRPCDSSNLSFVYMYLYSHKVTKYGVLLDKIAYEYAHAYILLDE